MHVTICWYCHVSWATDDDTFSDLSHQSLQSILTTHANTRIPVCLAITGAFLLRLKRIDPETFYILKELVEAGIVELVGTFFHEVFVPITDISYLEKHIVADLELKNELFGKKIESFLPANFNWSPALQVLLPDFGIEDVILDETHLRVMFANIDTKWSPENKKPDVSTIPTLADIHDTLSTFRVGNLNSQTRFHFRSIEAVLTTTYGISGGIHKALCSDPFKEFEDHFSGLKGVCLIADDFDRVCTASVSNYKRFLEKIGSGNFVRLSERSIKTINYDIDFVPGHTTAGLYDFWLEDPGAIHWIRVLDELSRSIDLSTIDERILRLQDCFPIFYSKHLDSLKFWRLAKEVLTKA